MQRRHHVQWWQLGLCVVHGTRVTACWQQLALCIVHDSRLSCVRCYTDGPLEFLFVVDDAADPACAALRLLVAQHEGVNARIVVAPHARQSSQKIRK